MFTAFCSRIMCAIQAQHFEPLLYSTVYRLRIGEGKRWNEFAEWHVAWLAEWHNHAEFNISSWMIQRNKLNWKERPFWRQSICKRSRCFNVVGLTYDDNQKITKAHCRPAKPKRFFFYWRKDAFEGHAPFYFNFFCKRCSYDKLNSFLLPIFVFETVWEVPGGEGGYFHIWAI